MSKMKYSGIEWIGDIPENWNLKKIKYIYNIQTGFTPDTTRDDYYSLEKQNVWVSIADLTSCEGKYINDSNNYISNLYIREKHPKIVKKDSLLYSFKLSVGKTAFAGKDLYTNEAIAAFGNNNNIRLNYLNYASFLIEYNSNKNIYNALILNQELIKNSITIIPPLNEQKLIADFLDEKVSNLDNILLNLNKQIEILDRYKKSMITETVTKGLNKNVEYKETNIDWIGCIPKHWKIKRLRYLFNDIKVGPFGSSLSGDDIKNKGDYWVYNQRNVLDNNFFTNDTFIDNQKFKELKSFEVKKGDLLLTTRGTIGKVAIVPEKFTKGVIHPCLIRFTIKEDLLSPKLLKMIFNDSYIVQEQLNYKSNSTTIEVIYSYNLKDIYVPIIPKQEQNEIIKYLDKKCEQIDKIIEEKQKQIEKIEEYKKSVIYEYVTGKKRVEGAEELYG